MPKLKIEFEGFSEVLAKLKSLDGDVRKTTEDALRKTHAIVTQKAEAAIAPHRRTGQTQGSLRKDAAIEWQGDVGSVKVGFNIYEGGLPSIFLMYGTPRMQKDQKLYNAFYGSATLKEITEAQQEIFFDEIRRLEG